MRSHYRAHKRRVRIFLILAWAIGLALAIWGAKIYEDGTISSLSASKVDIPQASEEESREAFAMLFGSCPKDSWSCWAENLKRTTGRAGPAASLDALATLQEQGLVAPSLDDHQLAHEVGRKTAEVYGVNSEAFLRCPQIAFNGGCQHGYFEYVLGKTQSPREAAVQICEALGDEYSSKFHFYCYHGVGHGVMMAQAYDLFTSLSVCDSLPTPDAQDGCWQGVFMENTNAAMRGEARTGVFDENDPLKPCDQIDMQYRHECYINHAGWLMRVFHNDVALASQVCTYADQSHIYSCMQSIGLMVSNPSWQSSLASNTDSISEEKITWELCKKFPQAYIVQCVIGAVDNLVNFDSFNPARAKRFCEGIDSAYSLICAREYGRSLRTQTIDARTITSSCAAFAEPLATQCLSNKE